MIKRKERIKKYTSEELKELYWLFREETMKVTETSGLGFSSGGGSCTKISYGNHLEDFLIWLSKL